MGGYGIIKLKGVTMKIALISLEEEIIDGMKKVIGKFGDVELKVFRGVNDFLSPFSNEFRLIVIDFHSEGGKAEDVVKRISQLNPDGWIVALASNVFHTYDLTDAGANITILRSSMDLMESLIEGIVNPKSPGEVEEKYGYSDDQ